MQSDQYKIKECLSVVMSVVCKKCDVKFKSKKEMNGHLCIDSPWICRCGHLFKASDIEKHIMGCPTFLLFEEGLADSFIDLLEPIILFKQKDLAAQKAKLNKNSPQALRDKLDDYQRASDIMVAGLKGKPGSEERQVLISNLRKRIYGQNSTQLKHASNFLIMNGYAEKDKV